MRQIHCDTIRDAVKSLYLQAAYNIGRDVERAMAKAAENEPLPLGRTVLGQLLENYAIARDEQVAICQDTGMAVLFADVGQEVSFVGGNFQDAINQGVRQAYGEGYLRKSVVAEPLFNRVNTGDNTPAVVYPNIVPGDKVHLLALAKGFGSENMSRLKMLTPAQGEQGVLDFIIETAREAGPNPCPPIILGVGVGGTMDSAAVLAKRMTARAVGIHHSDPRYAALEQKALTAINRLGIGPAGIGGRCTALAVNIDYAPTHIAGLPVAVNVCCHAARHAEITF